MREAETTAATPATTFAPPSTGHGDDYLLGWSEQEVTRLIWQGELFRPFTRRLFEEAGLKPGMRVLDLGSGAGDVAMLAAELVGPEGDVVGVDRDPRMVAIARHRARAHGHHNVDFMHGEIGAAIPPGAFDALVGRLILMYVPKPADVLRAYAPRLRRGAVVAFQEFDFPSVIAEPSGPLLNRALRWWLTTLRRAGIEERMGPKLYPTFVAAGLPRPSMRMDAIIGGAEDSPVPQMLADVLRSVLPVMVRLGVATEAEVEIETLAGRLWAEAVSGGGCLALPPLIGAWTRVS
jgi:ubiquinone/menaquinone biosynthesis C-methylase UbiE